MSVPISGGYIVAERTPKDATRSCTSISRVSRAAQRTADAATPDPLNEQVSRCAATSGVLGAHR